MLQKRVLCSSCDIYCQVIAEVGEGGTVRIKAADPRPLRANICMKGVHAPEGFDHKDRIRHPLRRVGGRGSGNWERVTWDGALDDIAARLTNVVKRYGPDGFAVSASPWLKQPDLIVITQQAARYLCDLGKLSDAEHAVSLLFVR
jgi:anaerobic selenocysteine-containing dehydrogenase